MIEENSTIWSKGGFPCVFKYSLCAAHDVEEFLYVAHTCAHGHLQDFVLFSFA